MKSDSVRYFELWRFMYYSFHHIASDSRREGSW